MSLEPPAWPVSWLHQLARTEQVLCCSGGHLVESGDGNTGSTCRVAVVKGCVYALFLFCICCLL